MKKRLPPLTIEWLEGATGAFAMAHFTDYDGAILRDERGRYVGVELSIQKSGPYGAVTWLAQPQATRNAAGFGPVQPTRRFSTLEDAKAHLERYARAAHARMARKFGRIAPLVESIEASLKQRGAR